MTTGLIEAMHYRHAAILSEVEESRFFYRFSEHGELLKMLSLISIRGKPSVRLQLVELCQNLAVIPSPPSDL